MLALGTLNMNSLAVRLASFLSACLILLTAFHVMVSVSADSIENDDLAAEDVALKRLTVSNVQASNPSSVVVNGTIHLAWADGPQDDMTLRWKCSVNNGSSYSSDLSLTPSFGSITGVSIDGDDDSVVIVFCGTHNGTEGTYALSSSDQGATWSRPSYLSNGTGADVVVHENKAFISLFREDNGTEMFYIVRGNISSSSLESCQAIMAMSVPQSKVEMLFDNGLIYFALAVDSTVVLGSADANGTIMDQPAAIWRGDEIADIALSRGMHGPEIWIAHNSVNGSSIRHGFATAPGDLRSWEDVDHGTDRYGSVSAAASNGRTMVSWDRTIEGTSEVACALFDGETITYGPKVISNGTAFSPVIIATDGFDIIFVQECERQELFSYRDVMFTRPDLKRLISWTASQDESVFCSAASRDALVDDLGAVLEAFESNDAESARSMMSKIRDGMDGVGGYSVSFSFLDLRSDKVRDTIERNLEYYCTADATEFASPGPGPQGGGMQSISGTVFISSLSASPINSDAVELFWYTDDVPSTTEVHYGPTTEYGRVRIGESGTVHRIVINNLESIYGWNLEYHFKVVSRSLTDPNHSAESDDLEVEMPDIMVDSLEIIILDQTSVEIRWLTGCYTLASVIYWGPVLYEEAFDYYLPDTPAPYHCVRLYDLDPDSIYHFVLNTYSDGYSGWSEEYLFSINVPVVCNVAVDIIGPDAAEVTWTRLGDQWVDVLYGTTTDYGEHGGGSPYWYSCREGSLLTGLSPDTLYHFKLMVLGYRGTFESEDYTFTFRSLDGPTVTAGPDFIRVEWTTDFFATSEVYYITDKRFYDDRLDRYSNSIMGDCGTSHYVILTGLEQNTAYHIRVVSRSPFDPNEAAASEDIVVTTGTISDIVVIPIIDGSFAIKWTTSIAATAEIHYGPTAEYGSIAIGTSGTSHSVTITDLLSNTLYHFQISSRSLDNANIKLQSDDATFRTVAICIPSIDYVLGTALQIDWSTNIEGTTEVYWGTTSSYGNVVTGASGTSHSITLENLVSNTTYHFKIVSRSATNQNDIAQSSDMTFVTIGIYGLAVITSADEAQIAWNTNVYGTTEVQWGTTASYGNTVTGTSGTSHSVTFTGLASATAYHFTVISRSSQYPDDFVRSDDAIFVTAGVEVSNVYVAYTGFSTVRIEWTSSVAATSVVRYGTTAACTGFVAGTSGTSHSVTITDLVPGTAYYFKVESTSISNPGDVAYSGIGTFDTCGITGIVVEKLIPTVIRITWMTDIPGTSEVAYGTTVAYGSSIHSNAGTSHQVTIMNLVPGIVYHFKVISHSATNPDDIVISPDRTFIIGVISDITFDIGISSARITWTTDVPTTSEIVYGTTTDYGSSAQGVSGTSHSVIVTGLSPSTTYHFKIVSCSTLDSSVVVQSEDICRTSFRNGDAGTDEDVGNLDNPTVAVPGIIFGSLNGLDDLEDCYLINVLKGQVIDIVLNVPSGFDYDLYVLHKTEPQYYQSSRAESRTLGGTEHIRWTSPAQGTLRIEVSLHSGSGMGEYILSTEMLSGGVDVGWMVVGANSIFQESRWPGIALLDGWAPSGVPRSGIDATMLFNIYDNTYQMSTDYLLTFKYYSSQPVTVQVYNGAGWVNIGTLPGRTADSTASVVLSCEYFHDSMPDELGMNVKLRLVNALQLYNVGFVARSYSVDASDVGSSEHNPGISFGTGWTIDGAMANGVSGATFIVSVPLTRVSYELQFDFLDSRDGQTVQMYTSSGWVNVGTLHRHGTSAAISLNMGSYYDSDASLPGMNLLVRVNGPLYNLSSVTMAPVFVNTDVGAEGDGDYSALSKYLFGVTIFDNGEWSGRTTVDGYTVRTTTTTSTNFLLNAPLSGQQYRIDIRYKTSSAGAVRQWGGTAYQQLGTLTADGAWHFDSYWTLLEFFDYPAGADGFISALFDITSSGAVVDSIFVYADSDQDTLVDRQEIELGTSPLMADTDSDNLRDDVELVRGTNPTNPDTDNDGLVDGNEQWSQTWSTAASPKIVDRSTISCALSIPTFASSTAKPITGLSLYLGIEHTFIGDLYIYVSHAGKSAVLWNRQGGSADHLYKSYDLLTMGFTVSDLASSSAWTLTIEDRAGGDEGRLEYFRVQVNGGSDPLDADSDDDGILDGEEVNLGTDGWITNPMLKDTDSDGLNDRNEIIGSTPCGKALNPTNPDTDGDGFGDGVDKYLGDMVIHICFDQFKPLEDNHNPFFFVIYYNGEALPTARFTAPSGTMVNPGLDYYIDVPDTATSQTFNIHCVAEQAGWLGDDVKMDGVSGDARDYSFTYYFSYGSYSASTQGSQDLLDFDTDVYYHFYVEKVVDPSRSRTIVINSTEENSDLYVVGANNYRYTADDQVYMLFLRVSGSSEHFVNGINTVIVPRYIALDSLFNDLLTAAPSSSGAAGGSIYVTDASQASASSNIVAVISRTTSMSASQAENLLYQLTHKSVSGQPNEKIANSVVIAQSNIYTLGLPSDVISRIPYSLTSDAIGDPPDYIDFGEIVDTIVKILMTVGTVLYNFADNLYRAGVSLLCSIADSAAAAINTAIAKLQTSLAAFKTWAIQFIEQTAHSMLDSILSTIRDVLGAVCSDISANSHRLYNEMSAGGSSEASKNRLMTSIFGGDLTNVVIALAMGISIAFAAIYALTGGSAFLISAAVSTVATIIIQGVFGDISLSKYLGDLPSSISASTLMDLTGVSEQSSNLSYNWLDVVCSMLSFSTGLVGIFVGALVNTIIGGIGLIIGLSALFIGLYAFVDSDDQLAWIGVVLGFISAVMAAIDYISSGVHDTAWLILMVLLSTISIGTGLIPLLI